MIWEHFTITTHNYPLWSLLHYLLQGTTKYQDGANMTRPVSMAGTGLCQLLCLAEHVGIQYTNSCCLPTSYNMCSSNECVTTILIVAIELSTCRQYHKTSSEWCCAYVSLMVACRTEGSLCSWKAKMGLGVCQQHTLTTILLVISTNTIHVIITSPCLWNTQSWRTRKLSWLAQWRWRTWILI